MKNIFSKISSFAKNISNTAKEKIDNVGSSVRNKVGAILTGSFLAVSTSAIAENNWVQVDTPGMGPREFSVKYFNTPNWELLKDKEGKLVENPNTDFRLGREYTIGRREDIVKKETKKIPPVTRVDEKKVEVSEKKENPFVSKEIYNVSYQDLISSFDYDAFIKSIIGVESRGNPRAYNKKTGATGLVQLTKPALISLGYHKNGEVTQGMLEQLKSDSNLQLKLTHKYHTKSLKIISENPEMLNKGLKQGKKQDIVIVELLAEAHFAGYGSMGKGWKGGDGFTTIPEYKGKTVKNYLKLVAANDSNITEKAQVSEASPNTFEKVTFASVVIEERKVIPVVLTEAPQVEKIVKTQLQSANDTFYSEKVTDLKKVSSPGIQTVVTNVEVRVNEVVAGIQDTMMRQSIEKKLSSPYETKIEGLYANLYHYDNLAIQYEKEARSAIRVKRESLLADAKDARNTANKIKLVISHFEGSYLQKAA